MTDPYPPELLELEPSLKAIREQAPLAAAINRLAQAVEQLTLATLDQRVSPQPGAQLAPLPPVAGSQAAPDPTFDGCPIHHQPWKVVPAGVSKKTGNAYVAFRACPVAGCDQRPRL